MKKILLIPALLALAPMAATAQTDHSGLYMGPTLQVRASAGGDNIEEVLYTNGDSDKMRAGSGVEFAAGWHVQPYRNSPFDLRAQIGYKYFGSRADNANIYMDRVTWELIPSVQIGAGFWAGAGLLMHTNVRLHNDGFMGNPDIKFKNALGADFQLGWRWLALTYTNMKYKTEDTGQKANANNLGLQFTWSFGWTCCGGSDQQYSRRGRTAQAPVYSPAVATPVYSPALAPPPPPPPVYVEPAAVSPEPAATSMPPPAAAAPAPAAAAVGTAQLVPGAVLRAGPTMKSEAIKSLPNGGSVKLLKRETNAEGPWWSVQLEDGTTGWMIEWALSRISKH